MYLALGEDSQNGAVVKQNFIRRPWIPVICFHLQLLLPMAKNYLRQAKAIEMIETVAQSTQVRHELVSTPSPKTQTSITQVEEATVLMGQATHRSPSVAKTGHMYLDTCLPIAEITFPWSICWLFFHPSISFLLFSL